MSAPHPSIGRHILHGGDLETAEAALAGDGDSVAIVMEILQSPGLKFALMRRGATASEADELIGDLAGDCYGGSKGNGVHHRILGAYNGYCALAGFLQRVAINRLITLKRKARHFVEPPTGEDGESVVEKYPSPTATVSEDRVLELLREAIVETLASVDREKLVVFRLVHAYGVPQKRLGLLWGWHESKVSRSLASLQEDLKQGVLARLKERDPWLTIEWDDFVSLCSQSLDLFGH
jgi:hypothetical protein